MGSGCGCGRSDSARSCPQRFNLDLIHRLVVLSEGETRPEPFSGEDAGQPVGAVLPHTPVGDPAHREPGGRHLVALCRLALPGLGQKDVDDLAPGGPEGEQEEETHIEAETGAPKEEEEEEEEEERKEEDEGRIKSVKFDTEDIRKIVTPEEIDEKRIEEFLRSLKKREEETRILAEKEEAGSLPPEGLEEEKEDTTAKDDMPLWAEKIKRTPPSELPDDKKEISVEEGPQFEKELPDIPIADEEIPEKEEKPPLEVEPDYSGPSFQEGLPFDEEEGRRMRFSLPSNLFQKIKIFAFDIFSITAVWFLALWIASRLVNTSLSRLFSASAPAVIVFYLILLASYFSLFLFFLGETLGSYIFSEES